MKKMLTNNLVMKLLSIVAAIMLWLIVVNIDDPISYQEFSGIRVTILNEDAVVNQGKVYKIEEDSDVITIRVKAKRSVLDTLSSDDFTATADIEKNIKYGDLVGIEVTCRNKNVKTTDITKSRENVVISVEDASSEQFNVIVKQTGTAGNGYVVGTAVPEQSMIQISGPASIIAKISRVEAEINVKSWTSDRTVNCKLKIYDSAENELDTTYLEYPGKEDGMNVSVTMLKTKDVPLEIGSAGTPADGYSFTGLSYKPETLKIAGSTEALSEVSSLVIPDEAVNIDGLTEDTQLTLDVTEYLPSGIRLADTADASVAVVVQIEKKQGKTVKIPVADIELQNVPRGLEVDFGSQKEIEVVIMGTSAELAELDTDEIQVSLDLSTCTKSGSYTRAVEVSVPEPYSLMDEVEIEFKLVKTQ